MEEFTTTGNTPTNGDPNGLHSDNRKVSLEPIHEDVRANELSDTEIVASHVNGGAIGNIEVDREVTNAAGYAPHPDVDPEKLRIKSLPPKLNAKMIMERIGLALILLGLAYLVYKLLFP